MKTTAIILKQLLTGVLFLVLFGCKKGTFENQPVPSDTEKLGSSLASSNLEPDIYVTGSLNGQAVYWKNKMPVILPGGNLATGIVVAGTDIHVSGAGIDPATGNPVALYWKNGQLTQLSDGTSEVTTTGIGISEDNVIIAGYEGRYVTTACYWKNGVRTNLEPPGSGGLTGQVFVATNGSVYIPNRNTYRYWKDYVLQPPLGLPAGVTSAYVNAVKEIGGIVYAVGVRDVGASGIPLFWIDGLLQTGFLGNPDGYAEVHDMAISETGAYRFAGSGGPDWGDQRIMYWDAGGGADYWGTAENSSLARIALDGTDVYICGSEQSKAMYWKNSRNNVIDLNDGTTPAIATDIKVVY